MSLLVKGLGSLAVDQNSYMYSGVSEQAAAEAAVAGVVAAAEERRREVHIELDAVRVAGVWSKWVLSHLVVIAALSH